MYYNSFGHPLFKPKTVIVDESQNFQVSPTHVKRILKNFWRLKMVTMTSDLEKKFFDTFGIERNCCNNYEKETCPAKICTSCDYNDYPEITDRILLDLICIANKFSITTSETIEELKEETIQTLIDKQEILTDEEGIFTMAHWARKEREKEKQEVYTQVRVLFGLGSEKK